jgi:hypothetical protein
MVGFAGHGDALANRVLVDDRLAGQARRGRELS